MDTYGLGGGGVVEPFVGTPSGFCGFKLCVSRALCLSRGRSECALVPVFVLGEHPPKPPFWKPTLLSTPELLSSSYSDYFHYFRNWEKGGLERGICIELSEIDFQFRNKFATILHTLSLMHETKYWQFGANSAHNLQQIRATSP